MAKILKWLAVAFVFVGLVPGTSVSAEVTLEQMEFTDEQSLLLGMMNHAPNYFTVEFDNVPDTVTVNLEKLSEDGTWEVDELFVHDVSSAEMLMLIELHPLFISFQDVEKPNNKFFYGVDSPLYPRDNKTDGKLMGAYWPEDIITNTDGKIVVGYPILFDVSIINDNIRFLQNFTYDAPDTAYPNHIVEVFAITMDFSE